MPSKVPASINDNHAIDILIKKARKNNHIGSMKYFMRKKAINQSFADSPKVK